MPCPGWRELDPSKKEKMSDGFDLGLLVQNKYFPLSRFPKYWQKIAISVSTETNLYQTENPGSYIICSILKIVDNFDKFINLFDKLWEVFWLVFSACPKTDNSPPV
jgi:hypothetical protein